MITDQSTNKVQKCLILDKTERLNPLYKYVEDIKNKIKATGSAVYVIQENKVIGEWYSGFCPLTGQEIVEDSRFNLYSARKSYIGLAVAILLNEKKIANVDDEVINYLEEIDEDICKEITIRHLVTHTHGLSLENDRLVKVASPGTIWEYNDAGLGLLYRIIKKVSGKDVNQIIREYVFEPFGFSETGWEITNHINLVADIFESFENPKIRLDDATGFGRNLFVSARELAHWGYLHLNKGNLSGKQILPKELFELTTRTQTPREMINTHQNGFFWFKNENGYIESELGEYVPPASYQILGASGCTCLVMPEYNAVAVRMYNKIGNPDGYDYLRDIKNFGNLVSTLLK
ncbi:serine hydrolase domain-containing protein [Bacillus sp. JJ664]